MSKAKRIFFVTETKDLTDKLLSVGLRRQVKGFIRLGHDTQIFSYNNAIIQTSPFRSRKLIDLFYKLRADELLVKRITNYRPEIVIVSFARHLDARTLERLRQTAPDAALVGVDVDLWPELHKRRVEAAVKLDIVLTTYAGSGQQAFKNAGVLCIFMPNMCDPDIGHRYEVCDELKSDILFTGKLKHKHYPTEEWRIELVSRLSKIKKYSLYGCCGRPFIGGIEYFYAISGAKIGISINAVNDIRLYHSDRPINCISCGTLALAKRVPDSDSLFEDGVHLNYFDTTDEFFDLAEWYLKHEQERERIAKAGIERAHIEFNCERIVQYLLDLVEKGKHNAPWAEVK